MGIFLTKIDPPSKMMPFIPTLWFQKPKALNGRNCFVLYTFQIPAGRIKSLFQKDAPLKINPCDIWCWNNQLQKHNEHERQTSWKRDEQVKHVYATLRKQNKTLSVEMFQLHDQLGLTP